MKHFLNMLMATVQFVVIAMCLGLALGAGVAAFWIGYELVSGL